MKTIYLRLLLAAFALPLVLGITSGSTKYDLQLILDSLPPLKPEPRTFGVSYTAPGLKGLFWENNFDTLVIQIRQVHSREWVFRSDLTVVSHSSKFSEKDVDPNGDYTYMESSTRQTAFGLAPGVERHFTGTRRLDPYVGAALSFAFSGKVKTSEQEDEVYANGAYYKRTTAVTSPGGFGFGLDVFAGLNYYLARHVALGLEYNFGYALIQVKGEYKATHTLKSKPTAAAPETTTTTESEGDEIGVRSSYAGNKGVAGLSLIYYFGK